MNEKVDTNVPDSNDIANDVANSGAISSIPKGSKLKDFLRAGISDPNYDKTGNNEKSTLGPDGEPSPDFTDGTNDISSKSRRMFGKYLSNSTAVNGYPVAQPVAGQEAFNVSSRGPNASLVDPGNNGQEVFISQAENKLSNNLKSYGLGVSLESNRGTFFDDGQISSVLSKVGDDENLSGHTLLKDITPSGVSQGLNVIEAAEAETRGFDIVKYVHDNLVQINRLNPGDPDPVVDTGEYGSKSSNNGPFIRDPNATQEDEALRGIFTVQRDLGKFHRNPEPGGSGEVVTSVEMSRRALSIMLKAGNNSVGSDEVLVSGGTSVVREFIFSEIIKIPQVNVLDLRMSATDPTGKGQATGQSDLIPGVVGNPDTAVVTRKQLNTYLEPFDDLTKPGMLFASLTAILSVIVSALAITLIIVGIKAIGRAANLQFSPVPDRNPQNPASLTFGRNKRQEESDGFLSNLGSTAIRALRTIFGPTETDNNFTDCVPAGMAAIFGFPNVNPNDFVARLKSGGVQSLVDIIFNIFSAPGYYANFLRTIIGDNVALTKSFSSISSSSPENIITSVKALTNSNIYRFIMVSAGVGDAILKSNGSGLTRSPDNYFATRDKQKNVKPEDHAIILNSVAGKDPEKFGGALGILRQKVSRWGDGRNPQSLTTYVASQKGLYKNDFDFGKEKSIRGLTPSRENVEHIENSLESEYMPFYIHDLRTHEVISMPAFITDFSETFTASYNAVKGMGRQDAVRMYQDTERQITLSFMLISFNSSDHDHMWMTINKLIAMCYPQYSKGRIRQLDGNENLPFIQPFSQVPAASPMIRLRLGDVFKSNYSKFGLARLFGAGMDIGLTDQAKNKEISEATTSVQTFENNAKEKYQNEWKKKLRNSKLTSQVNVVIKKGSLISHSNGMLRVLQDFTARVFAKDNVAIPTEYVGATSMDNIKKFCYYPSDLPNDPGKTLFDVIALQFVFQVNIKNIEIDPDEQKQYISNDSDVDAARKKLANLQSAKYPEDFFEKTKNSVVRSFESTRGRGVAGFITSLGFNYDVTKIMWDVDAGKRAPQAVMINMGFSPITDLPLGLDYDGHMRNPSHPVGRLAGSFGDVYGGITLKSSGFSASPIRGADENVRASSDKSKNEAQSTLDDLTRP